MPNPVNTVSMLNITSATNAKMNIKVIDMLGNQVSNQTINLIAGKNLVPLNFANLSAGTYQLIGFSADGQIKTLQFVK